MFYMRQATNEDIPSIEAMYKEVVIFQDSHEMHQWYEHEVTWEAFSKTYDIQDYYVGIVDNDIVCGLFIVDEDALYWPEQAKGSSLYLHKICVHPNHRGKGYADNMITFFKEKGHAEGYSCVRLDVREKKQALRAMYERNGFQYLKTGQFVAEFTTALYEYTF